MKENRVKYKTLSITRVYIITEVISVKFHLQKSNKATEKSRNNVKVYESSSKLSIRAISKEFPL